jgi:hypothetical protein
MTSATQRTIYSAVLLCLVWVAYFVAADMGYIHTGYMSAIFRSLLLKLDGMSVWIAMLVCLLALAWKRPAPILALVDLLGRRERVTALVCVVLVCGGTLVVYYNHPYSMDEYAPMFQARVFASGHLTAHLPPQLVDWLVVPKFNGEFLRASHATGAAIESYWPGFALLLTPFVFLGAPWLCNALLAGIALCLIHRMTMEITDSRRAAGWAVLFALGSGAFVVNAISYYSMQAHLTANLLFAWLLFRPTAQRCLAAGLVGSLALVLHNPFPHAMFAAPWVIGLALDRSQRRHLLTLILGYLPLSAGLGLGWLILRSGIAPTVAQSSTFGGLVGSAFQAPDTLLLSMRIACTAKLWVWAVPGLLVFAALGARQQWSDRRVRLLALSALVTFCGYLVVSFDQGHGWGYRYFHSAWGVIPVLAGCAMARVPDSDRLHAFAGASAILSLLLLVPLQLWQVHEVIGAQLAQLNEPLRPGNNIYFIRNTGGLYVTDLVQIDPLLRTPDLLLSSRGEALDSELIRQNWPNAARVMQNGQVTQWHLGEQDQRRATAGESYPHLQFEQVPVPTSPAALAPKGS